MPQRPLRRPSAFVVVAILLAIGAFAAGVVLAERASQRDAARAGAAGVER